MCDWQYEHSMTRAGPRQRNGAPQFGQFTALLFPAHCMRHDIAHLGARSEPANPRGNYGIWHAKPKRVGAREHQRDRLCVLFRAQLATTLTAWLLFLGVRVLVSGLRVPDDYAFEIGSLKAGPVRVPYLVGKPSSKLA